MSKGGSFSKRSVKKGLHLVKRTVKKNQRTHRAALKLRNLLLSGSRQAEVYDHRRYYPTVEDYFAQTHDFKDFRQKPLISVVMPTYNTSIKYLVECIESVIIQSYPNWELCIADDASNDPEVVRTIRRYIQKDKRVKLVERKQNGHISLASNSALKIATGDYVGLLDHDDLLWPNALYEVVKAINDDPAVDFIYSDEDKIDAASQIHSYPFFKPDWSPEFLESCNYITHFACIRRTVIDQIGGFRKGYEGAQDWDLFIRATELTDKIYHIPKVLYSWRVHEASTAQDTDAKPYVYEAQKKLLQDHVARLGAQGSVHSGLIWQHSIIDYQVAGQPSVSVVVYGTKANAELAGQLLKNSGYPSSKVHVETVKQLTATLAGFNRVEYLVLIPDATVTMSDDWLYKFIADSQRPGIGIVGGRLMSLDGQTLYSAGLGIGLGDYYLPLLNGESMQDDHYMRALHGKSRRNVLAVEAPLIINRHVLEEINLERLAPAYFVTDLCLTAVRQGFRCVYSPYIASTFRPADRPEQRLDQKAAADFKRKWADYINYDPFVNPNYVKTNGKLEVG